MTRTPPKDKKATQLSEAKKRAFLDNRLKRRGFKHKPIIAHRDTISPAPVTYAQEGVWYAEQLQPDIPTYNMPWAWRLRGPLNLAALERGLNAIIQRHESLRTHFEVMGGQPVQIINDDIELSVAVTDLQAWPATERAAEALALLEEEVHRPFNLAQAPLLRATLLQLAPEEYFLILNMHHIIGDGWSLDLLKQELVRFYAAFVAAEPVMLSSLPIQYADFAVWQRQQAQIGAFEPHLTYWRETLADAPPLLELPTDYPRPARPSYRGDKLHVILPEPLSQALKDLSLSSGNSLFAVLLATFKLLLYRYTGQADIVVGTPMVNRNQTETEELIGYFLNNLILRSDLSGQPTFHELLDRLRVTTLDAYSHQHIPFEQLVQTLQPERNRSYTPFFQVFFNMYPYDLGELDLAGLTSESLAPDGLEPGSKFDLTLYAREDDNVTHLILAYSTDLFRLERMAELLAQYKQLLMQIAADPDRSIIDYSLVTPAARRRLPALQAALDKPSYPTVGEMIERWATQTPHQPALSQGDRTGSYRQLVRQAKRIAQTLHAKDLGKGEVVAVYAPRSFGLIAGMIGVLMSGGVLLLIDPSLPAQRQRLMLREAKAKYLITVEHTSPAEPLATLDVDLPQLSVAAENGQVTAPLTKDIEAITLPDIAPDDPAYIFFTSGTTGTPKGVLGCHQGLSHFLQWQGETFEITPGDRAAQLTGLSFDVVLRDVLTILTRGGTLCLPDSDTGLNPDEVIDWLAEADITMLHTVPTLAQAWLANVPAGTTLPSVRHVFFAGEPLTETLVQRWRAIFPHSQIVNLYGPTETTMAKCFYVVPDVPSAGVQPVGQPLPHAQALVLGENRQLCGIGEPGEIVLRTPFRTLGYINLPDEACFTPNPFSNETNDLLYHTGDRGRYLPDGTLEILGRMDNQVKIRGVRIELDEVTTALVQHPAIKAGVVIAVEDEQEQTRLVAYVVPQAPTASATTLRIDLSRQLPPAMVPSLFINLERLPLTANGKVDRHQLPLPDSTAFDQSRDFVAPRDEIEIGLINIWQDVLGLEKISIHDNFFELGGHSLRAIQVIARLRRDYDLDIPLRHLFEYPTVAQLAPVIENILLETLDE